MKSFNAVLRRTFQAAGLCLLALLLAGCGATRQQQPVRPPAPSLAASPPPAFRVGDSLLVSFSDLPPPASLPPVNVELGEEGKITLHHNVTVQALGKTARQLEQEIRGEYVPRFYQYLTVIIKPEMRSFFVNGEVKMPSRYPWQGDISVLRAIGQAGGFTDWANRTKVQLTRVTGENIIVDCKAAQKDPINKDLPVFPGDYINVPRRGPLEPLL